MKKFYAILAAGMTAFSMNAQALHFIVNGKEEPAGSKIDITSTFEFDDKAYSYMFNPKMQLMADAAGPVSATVTFTNGECDPVFDELTWETGANLKIQWCAFGGACQFVEVGKSLTQTANLSANTPADMEMEFVGQIGDYQNLDEQKITAE